MARTLSGSVKIAIDMLLTNGTSGASDTTTINRTATFANGTGANQAQREWTSIGRTLSAGANEDLDMFDLGTVDIGGGAGNDALGLAHAITGVKMLYVHNRSTSGGVLTVGNKNATTAFNTIFNASDVAAITLAPGATFLFINESAAGVAVADSSNHLLKFLDAGSGCTFDVSFIGI